MQVQGGGQEGRRAGGQEGRRQGQEPILDPMGRAAWV